MKRKRKALTLGALAWRGYLQVTTFAIGVIAIIFVVMSLIFSLRTKPEPVKSRGTTIATTSGTVGNTPSKASPKPRDYSFQDFAEEHINAFFSSPELISFAIFFLIISVVMVICLIVLGKNKAPRYLGTKGDYERKNPIPDAHPVTLSRLWNGNALIDDIILAILALSEKDVVKPEDATIKDKYVQPKRDLSIKVLRDKQDALSSEIDLVLYKFLLDESEDGNQLLHFRYLFHPTKSRTPRDYQRDFLAEFFRAARNEAYKSGLFPEDTFSKSSTTSHEIAQRIYLFCLALPIISILFGIFIARVSTPDYSDSLILLIISCLPWMVYGVFWLIFDMKRNADGQRMLSRCRHLKKWLKHFTFIKSKESVSSILVWGKYAVYAYALDVGTKSIDELSRITYDLHECAIEIIEDHPDCDFNKYDSISMSSKNGSLYYKLIQGNLEFNNE